MPSNYTMVCDLCHKDVACTVYRTNEIPSVVSTECDRCHTQLCADRQVAFDAAHPECVAERNAQRDLQRAHAKEYAAKTRNADKATLAEARHEVLDAERRMHAASDACAATMRV